jgi:hypothetical protein
VAEASFGAVELLDGSAAQFALAWAEAASKSLTSSWYHRVTLADGTDYLRWLGLFEFLVSADGRHIACRSLSDTSWEVFQTYLLGQVLSYALIKQGVEPLHATVMVVDDKAVGLIGDCGYGKSSLAGAFIKAGHPLLTDDLLVFKEDGQDFLAYPSFPRIKLFPEVARLFLGDQVAGTPMNPLTHKLIIALRPDQSYQNLAPLKAIFVLRPPAQRSRAKRVTIRSMPKGRAFFALTANTFNAKVIDPERLKRLFTWAAKLAATIPIRSLSYPQDLARLPEVVQAIRASLPE